MTPEEVYLDSKIDNINYVINNAEYHRLNLRGLNLGTSITHDQWNEIKKGTFSNMFIGDYWTINNIRYDIADFDYWLNTGDTPCTEHHVVLVPTNAMYSAKMNNENIVTGGYVGSVMYKTNLNSAKNTIKNGFGTDHILSHRVLLSNAATSAATASAWYNSDVELMNCTMVTGNASGDNQYDTGIDDRCLSLFFLSTEKRKSNTNYWLRGVYGATYFRYIRTSGNVDGSGASYDYGVRPAFAIKG